MPAITGKVRVWVKILAVDIAFDVARDGACPPRPRRSAEKTLLSFVPCGAWHFQGPQEARLDGTVGIGAREVRFLESPKLLWQAHSECFFCNCRWGAFCGVTQPRARELAHQNSRAVLRPALAPHSLKLGAPCQARAPHT